MKAKDEVERLQRKIANGEMPPDEPLFVLRAQDVLSTRAVRDWAKFATATCCLENGDSSSNSSGAAFT